MRLILVLIIFIKSLDLFCQSDSAIFDENFIFKNGIYTSHKELLNNEPKYLNCKLDIETGLLLGIQKYFYFDQASSRQPFDDYIFAIVDDSELFVSYDFVFRRLILKGSVSTFFAQKIYQSFDEVYVKEELFFLDLMSGKILVLNPKNIDRYFKRDSQFYATYSRASNNKKNKTLYSFVLEYNRRNPFYIKTM